MRNNIDKILKKQWWSTCKEAAIARLISSSIPEWACQKSSWNQFSTTGAALLTCDASAKLCNFASSIIFCSAAYSDILAKGRPEARMRKQYGRCGGKIFLLRPLSQTPWWRRPRGSQLWNWKIIRRSRRGGLNLPFPRLLLDSVAPRANRSHTNTSKTDGQVVPLASAALRKMRE